MDRRRAGVGESSMKSDLVVISWWSNCLGLSCLHRLVRHTRQRTILVVQVGKPEGQKERFRAHLPAAVTELPYPAHRSGEDWRVREAVARELLVDRAGLWFIDHDLYVQEDCEGWLEDMDCRFADSTVCLCHPLPRRGPSITNPAFWLSPLRLPPATPSFARLPYHEDPVAHRPYAPPQGPSFSADRREAPSFSPERSDGGPAALVLPEKDTLVAAMEFLQERGMVCGFPLRDADRQDGGPASFPRYEHIGGLYTFAAGVPPKALDEWTARCVEQLTAFYATCPAAWMEVEDPALLQRLEEFRRAGPSRPGSPDRREGRG